MRDLPVLWSEGMLLSPHHFQAAERSWNTNNHLNHVFDHAHGYGLFSIEFNNASLAAGQLEIVSCQARMRDGTILTIGQSEGGPGASMRVELSAAFEQQENVTVYLGVPRQIESSANASNDDGDRSHRYHVENSDVADETNPSAMRPVSFRKLNAQLLIDSDDHSGYDVLPVARVARASENSQPRIDPDFIPPLLNVAAWNPLKFHIVQPILDLLAQKVQQLSEPLVSQGVNLASLQSADTSRTLLAMMLNAQYARLYHCNNNETIHPSLMYRELCSVAGLLAVFHYDRRLVDILDYDHDDLAKVFAWIKLRIEDSLRGIPLISYEMRFFTASRPMLRVDIESAWLGPGWQWFVGVKRGGLSRDDCAALLKQVYWKVGSARQVQQLFTEKRPDVGLVQADDVPQVLPTGQGWLFYTVDQSTPAWRDVADTTSMALRFSDREVSTIKDGDRDVVLESADSNIPLQFAIFAVAPQ